MVPPCGPAQVADAWTSTGAGCLWVLENKLRETSVVRAFSADTGREVAAWPLAGANCHNLHWHEGGLLYLTSQKVGATLLARHTLCYKCKYTYCHTYHTAACTTGWP